jgi:uncharacterized membrane protein YraQ (UPF0718 family)
LGCLAAASLASTALTFLWSSPLVTSLAFSRANYNFSFLARIFALIAAFLCSGALAYAFLRARIFFAI